MSQGQFKGVRWVDGRLLSDGGVTSNAIAMMKIGIVFIFVIWVGALASGDKDYIVMASLALFLSILSTFVLSIVRVVEINAETHTITEERRFFNKHFSKGTYHYSRDRAVIAYGYSYVGGGGGVWNVFIHNVVAVHFVVIRRFARLDLDQAKQYAEEVADTLGLPPPQHITITSKAFKQVKVPKP